MSTWQERIGNTIKGMTDKQEALIGGMQRGTTLAGDTLEKLASFGLGTAAEGVDAAVAQVKLLGQPGNPAAYLERQVELVSGGVRTVSGKAGELGELLSECAADTAALFEIAPPKAASRSRKAA